MHPVNGLQLGEWAKERHRQAITDAQRELRAKSVECSTASAKASWLRSSATTLINGLALLRPKPTYANGITHSDKK